MSGELLALTCEHCRAVFFRLPSRRRRFCSNACANEAMVKVLPSLEERFWSKADRGGDCWPWIAGRDPKGYGIFTIGGHHRQNVGAHRQALEMAFGPLPPGFCALHACDNPPCVRNDEPGIYIVRGIARPRFGHLWLGTKADNLADMVDKGRSATGDRNGSRTHPERLLRGEANPAARLTDEQVAAIRSLYSQGSVQPSRAVVAAQFGVSRRTIGMIVSGQRRAS